MEEPIAIIGMGCRFPGGASSPSKLWELLKAPRDLARTVPADRFNIDAFYHPNGDYHGRTNIREGYFLDENVHAFDAAFFNISPTEAAAMDPQQRLLLETVYESLDTAGLQMEALHGSMTGVFCGILRDDYNQIQGMDPQAYPPYVVTGNASCIIANRVSYFFDWRGPSMSLATGCSSSLLAVHQAVQALRLGDCSIAIAAGSNLTLSPTTFITDAKTRMMSATGRSRMWDSEADGYARGEGVASVVLKRLSDAVRDEDPISCLVRATGCNSDGRTAGINMPSGKAQQAFILATYARAGLSPQLRPEDGCQYFEAHGTGTQAGDPQEAAAIYGSFCGGSEIALKARSRLYVGSIKTLVGHTEATAGLAGLIKTVLSLQHGLIVPNLLLRHLSPKIEPFAPGLQVPTGECAPWPIVPPGTPRRASVNSFGFGGTNVHTVLESYTPEHQGTVQAPELRAIPLPVVFSASTQPSLTAVLESYATFLQGPSQMKLAHLSMCLWSRRSAHSHRFATTASSFTQLADRIGAELSRARPSEVPQIPSTVIYRPRSRPRRIMGVFTGQGAQWPQMGLDLLQSSPQVQQWMRELDSALSNLPSELRPAFTLSEELARPTASWRGHEGILSLPLRTALQIIQVNMLRAVGVNFTHVVGHSSGEIAAAYAAGLLSGSDAIRIAYLRAWAIEKFAKPNGAMMAVNLGWEQAMDVCAVEPYSGAVNVAAANSPSSVTLSGDDYLVHELRWLLKSLGLTPRMLKVDTAYHSPPYMAPCAEPYRQAMRDCPTPPSATSVARWYSSVYPGKIMGLDEDNLKLKDEYWVENMLSPVQLSNAVEAAVTEDGAPDLIVEVGPHPVLRAPVLETIAVATEPSSPIPYLALAERGKSGLESWATMLGQAWAYLGPRHVSLAAYLTLFGVDLPRLLPVQALPLYPFDTSQSYWAEARSATAFMHNSSRPNALLGSPSPDTGTGEFRWRNYLRTDELPWLKSHQAESRPCFPSDGFLSMALEAAIQVAKVRGLGVLVVNDLKMHVPLTLQDEAAGTEILISMGEMSQGLNGLIRGRFSCSMAASGQLVECATADLVMYPRDSASTGLLPNSRDSDQEQVEAAQHIDVHAFYQSLKATNYPLTDDFFRLETLKRRHHFATGTAKMPKRDPDEPICMHPLLMNLATQVMLAAIERVNDGRTVRLFLPKGVESACFDTVLCASCVQGTQLMVKGAVTYLDGGIVHGNVDIFTAEGQKLVQLEGVVLEASSPELSTHEGGLFSRTEWVRMGPTLEGLRDAANFVMPGKSQTPQAQKDLITLLTQICHRCPHANIIQIGSIDGDPSHTALPEGLELAFQSFTYVTLASPLNTEAKNLPKENPLNMHYTSLDPQVDPSEQGFRRNFYDAVIFTCKEFPKDRIEPYASHLLKPRGCLILLIREDPVGELANLLSHPTHEAINSTAEQGVDLKQAFARHGLESLALAGFSDGEGFSDGALGFSILLCRAPGSAQAPGQVPHHGHLLLFGGGSTKTDSLVSAISDKAMHGDLFDLVSRQADLETASVEDTPNSTILCLDHHQSLTDSELSFLQSLFETSRHLLWVTVDNTGSGLATGFLRNIMASKRYPCTVQLLHFQDAANATPQMVAHALRRLVAAGSMQNDVAAFALDSLEPEIFCDGKTYFIPRQALDRDRNKRQQASWGSVSESILPDEGIVQILSAPGMPAGDSFRLASISRPLLIEGFRREVIQLRVEYSSLAAVKVADASFLHVVIGRHVESDQRLVALSTHNASRIFVPTFWTEPVPDTVSKGELVGLLKVTIAGLLSKTLGEQIGPEGTLLVHEPTRYLSVFLDHLSARRNGAVSYSSSRESENLPGHVLFLHEHSAAREVCQTLPTGLTAVAILNDQGKAFCRRISSSIPKGVVKIIASDLFLGSATLELSNNDVSEIADTFKAIWPEVLQRLPDITLTPSASIAIQDVSASPRPFFLEEVVSWEASDPLTAQVLSAGSQIQLSGTKSYVLFGLTGELARIVCLWMASHGARWIILANIDPGKDVWWTQQALDFGTRVKWQKVNPHDRDSFYPLSERGRQDLSFPLIIGGFIIKPEGLPRGSLSELEGLMALQSHLSHLAQGLEQLERQSDVYNLDFWLIIDSMDGVSARADRVFATARSEMMASTVRRRRNGNKSASLVHMGEIEGLFNDEASSDDAPPWYTRPSISEQDVGDILAEAILASHPAYPPDDAEIFAGLGQQKGGPDVLIPRLWNFASRDSKLNAPSSQPLKKLLSVKEALAAASCQAGKAKAVADALMVQIRSQLGLTAGTSLSQETLLPELGVDSLVAMELNQWFKNDVGATVPVVWILSGCSLGELAAMAVGALD